MVRFAHGGRAAMASWHGTRKAAGPTMLDGIMRHHDDPRAVPRVLRPGAALHRESGHAWSRGSLRPRAAGTVLGSRAVAIGFGQHARDVGSRHRAAPLRHRHGSARPL